MLDSAFIVLYTYGPTDFSEAFHEVMSTQRKRPPGFWHLVGFPNFRPLVYLNLVLAVWPLR